MLRHLIWPLGLINMPSVAPLLSGKRPSQNLWFRTSGRL